MTDNESKYSDDKFTTSDFSIKLEENKLELSDTELIDKQDFINYNALLKKLNAETFGESTKISPFNTALYITHDTKKIMECVTTLQTKGINILHCMSENGSSEKHQTNKIIFLGNFNKTFKCKICSQTLNDKKQHKRHLLVHRKLRKLGFNRHNNCCIFCSDEFKSALSLLNHFRLKHSNIKPFQCEKCSRSYSDDYTLRRKHNCPLRNWLTCTPCKLTFKNREEFGSHSKLHHKDFLCEKCGKSYFTSLGLKLHLKGHNEEKKYSCQVCSMKFLYRALLDNHKKIHSDGHKRRFLCDQCPRGFTTKKTCQNHRERHSIRKVMCNICKKQFVSSECLNNHVNYTHLGIKKYQCELCLIYFSNKENMARHMKNHKNEKPKLTRLAAGYECTICGKKMKRRCLLKVHLVTHTQVRKYQCDICSLSFVRKQMLVRHMKTHRVEKNKKFRCELCYKKFATKEEVDLHFPKHKRPKRHKCSECGEQFGRHFSLESHRKLKHDTSQMKDVNDVADSVIREIFPNED